jgi:hypothetical protein
MNAGGPRRARYIGCSQWDLGLGSLPDIDLVPQIVVQSHAAASLLNSWIGDVARSAARRQSL